jgi:WD40 repeat protein
LSGGYFAKPAFSRDGKLLALPLVSTVEIREVTTLRLQNTLECTGDVVSVDFHPYDRSLISILCDDGTMEEWNLSAGTHLLYSVCEEDSGTTSYSDEVAYNADGTRMIGFGGGADSIFVRSTEDRSQPLMTTTVPAMRFKKFSLDSDGKHVDALFVSEGEPAVVKRWNLETGDEVKSLQIAMDEIECAVFSKDNTVLLSGHEYKICVWSLDSDSPSLYTTIYGDWGETWAIDVTRSGDVIASSGFDGVIRLFDASGAPLAIYHGHTTPLRSVVFSPQEDCLVSTSMDGTVRVWDTRKEAWSLSNSRRLERVVFSPNGIIIAAISDRNILIFDGRNGSILSTLTGHTDGVDSLTFSPDSTLLASVSSDDGVFLWSVGTKDSLPRSLSNSSAFGAHSYFCIVLSASGAQLAVVIGNAYFTDEEERSFQVRIWDVSNPKGVASPEPLYESFLSKWNEGHFPHFLRFSSNEPLALVRRLDPDDGNKVIVWDRMTNAVEEHDYDQEIHSPVNPAFDCDDQGWIVSVRTGKRLFWLPESRRPFYRHSFATHGNLIATASSIGVLSVLDLPPFENI